MEKTMKKFTALILSCTLVQSLAILLDPTQVALAGTPASDCVSGLLYDTDRWGRATRTSLSEQLAASVCQGVTTKNESTSIRECVSGLLYNIDSWGRATRTEISENTAISTCAIRRSSPAAQQRQPQGRVFVANRCKYPVRIAVRYQNLSGDWQTGGWWSFEGGEVSRITRDGTEVRTSNGIMYVYAKIKDGYPAGVWSGEEYRQFKNESLPMQERNLSRDKDGDYIVELTCDNT
jgi:uncharacterized membrane protein